MINVSAKPRPRRGLPTPLHGPAFALVRSAAALTHIAGIDASSRAVRAMGGAYARSPINASRLRKAKDSIAWCFPDWDEQRVHATAVESFRHLFSLAAELTWTPRFITRDGFPFYVEIGEISAALRALLSGSPTILVTGHCGNWELLGTVLSMLGFPVHAVYRPLDMKPLDDWMHRTRSAKGLTLVSKFGASNEFDDIVGAAKPLGFIADQNAGDRGLFVPFFNRLASSYKAISLLAMRHRAHVICGHARRLRPDERRADDASSDFRYRLEITDVFGPGDWEGFSDPGFYITARYRRAVETMVRAAPEQYLWMHRAWKSRPPHERPDREPGPFPARLRAKLEELPWMTPADLERIIDRSARDAADARENPKPRR